MPKIVDTDKLLRCLAFLTALRQNTSVDSIREYADLTTSHVNEFHTILSTISSIGIDVSEFFIPDQEVKPTVTPSPVDNATGRATGSATYSEEKYVRKSIFLAKLDAIINYLNMLLEDKPRKTGFQTPT